MSSKSLTNDPHQSYIISVPFVKTNVSLVTYFQSQELLRLKKRKPLVSDKNVCNGAPLDWSNMVLIHKINPCNKTERALFRAMRKAYNVNFEKIEEQIEEALANDDEEDLANEDDEKSTQTNKKGAV